MTLKEMRERLAELIQSARAVIDEAENEGRQLRAEDREKIAKIHAEAEELKAQIDTVEEQERAEAQLRLAAGDEGRQVQSMASGVDNAALQRQVAGGAGDGNQQAALAMAGWCLNAAPSLRGLVTDQHRAAMRAAGVDPADETMELRLPELYSEPQGGRRIDEIRNALSVGSDTGGGFTVPEGFVNSLEIALLQFGGMRNVATLLRTSTGEPLPHPTTNDTSNQGELVSENTAQSTTGTDVSFGSVVFNSYEYSSKFVRVSHQLLRDSAFNVPQLLGRLLGERLGRIQNTDCTTGNGAARPTGIINGAALGVTAASATALADTEIIRLIHSIDPAYRTSPGVGFMMHDSIFLEVSLLKDGNGNFLLRPGLEEGSPATLRGYRVTTNQSMASSLEASAKTLLFGDLSKYMIREVGSIRLQRLTERFAEYNQQAFVAFMSFDGGLLDAGTEPVKYLQQSS